MLQHAEESASELRASQRTNLLLTASLETDGLTMQVRIRNVSKSGALIEGPQVPKKGARLCLTRADLKIAGTIAWSSGRQAGVHFDERLGVELWTGGKPRSAEPAGLSGQQDVDALQQAIRDGLSTAAFDTAPPASISEEQLKGRIADEMNYVVRLIESLGDHLAGDPIILHKHAKSLQNIDLANQILSHLADLVTAQDPSAKVADIGMTDLRARLTRRSLS